MYARVLPAFLTVIVSCSALLHAGAAQAEVWIAKAPKGEICYSVGKDEDTVKWNLNQTPWESNAQCTAYYAPDPTSYRKNFEIGQARVVERCEEPGYYVIGTITGWDRSASPIHGLPTEEKYWVWGCGVFPAAWSDSRVKAEFKDWCDKNKQCAEYFRLWRAGKAGITFYIGYDDGNVDKVPRKEMRYVLGRQVQRCAGFYSDLGKNGDLKGCEFLDGANSSAMKGKLVSGAFTCDFSDGEPTVYDTSNGWEVTDTHFIRSDLPDSVKKVDRKTGKLEMKFQYSGEWMTLRADCTQ